MGLPTRLTRQWRWRLRPTRQGSRRRRTWTGTADPRGASSGSVRCPGARHERCVQRIRRVRRVCASADAAGAAGAAGAADAAGDAGAAGALTLRTGPPSLPRQREARRRGGDGQGRGAEGALALSQRSHGGGRRTGLCRRRCLPRRSRRLLHGQPCCGAPRGDLGGPEPAAGRGGEPGVPRTTESGRRPSAASFFSPRVADAGHHPVPVAHLVGRAQPRRSRASPGMLPGCPGLGRPRSGFGRGRVSRSRMRHAERPRRRLRPRQPPGVVDDLGSSGGPGGTVEGLLPGSPASSPTWRARSRISNVLPASSLPPRRCRPRSSTNWAWLRRRGPGRLRRRPGIAWPIRFAQSARVARVGRHRTLPASTAGMLDPVLNGILDAVGATGSGDGLHPHAPPPVGQRALRSAESAGPAECAGRAECARPAELPRIRPVGLGELVATVAQHDDDHSTSTTTTAQPSRAGRRQHGDGAAPGAPAPSAAPGFGRRDLGRASARVELGLGPQPLLP